jgi:peptide deformylase
MPLNQILQLGNPLLYKKSTEIELFELNDVKQKISELHQALLAFRDEYKCGRAIAAPQIGYMKRLIYMYIDSPKIFINPLLSDFSSEMIELWDDCMSFPQLLVKVKRHKSCKITYLDEKWVVHSEPLSDDLSELLQHEYDHLDGILATMRAIDNKSFKLK